MSSDVQPSTSFLKNRAPVLPSHIMLRNVVLLLIFTLILSHLVISMTRKPPLSMGETFIGILPIYGIFFSSFWLIIRKKHKIAMNILVWGSLLVFCGICLLISGPKPFLYVSIFNLVLLGGTTLSIRTGIGVMITFSLTVICFELFWVDYLLSQNELLRTRDSRNSLVPIIATLMGSGVFIAYIIGRTTFLIGEVKNKGAVVKAAREALSEATEANAVRASQGNHLANFASRQLEAISVTELIQRYTEHVCSALKQEFVAVFEQSGGVWVCMGFSSSETGLTMVESNLRQLTSSLSPDAATAFSSIKTGTQYPHSVMKIMEETDGFGFSDLTIQEEFTGKIMMMHRHPHQHSRETDQAFLTTLSSILLQGIHNLRTEAAFRQAQKMEALGILAKGVAHDFNNYLTTIQGNLDLAINADSAQEKDRERLGKIELATKQASYLTRRLISLSNDPLSAPHPHSLNHSISKVLQLFESDIPEGIELKQSLDSGSTTVIVDEQLLETAILNMLTNAVESIAPHSGTIHMETKYLDSDSPHEPSRILMRLTDSGRGISESDLGHIFEPFFTTKTHANGTGLGLASVTELVEKSNALCSVNSILHQGTSFELSFPASTGVDVEHQIEYNPAPKKNFQGDRELILLVEDDSQVRATIVELLSFVGFRILEATNIQQAFEVLNSDISFNLVISDVRMPGGTGFELVKFLEKMESPPPFILMTGFSHMKEYTAGDTILYKPFTMNQLISAVSQKLGKEQSNKNI